MSKGGTESREYHFIRVAGQKNTILSTKYASTRKNINRYWLIGFIKGAGVEDNHILGR